jgi:prolyl-tRNA synthetase
MTHSDDDGFVCPPRLAPTHVVILPITMKAAEPEKVLEYCESLAKELRAQSYGGYPVEVEVDRRDASGGEKAWSWIKKGVPVRVEVGPRDIAQDSVFMGRRDKPHREKQGVPRAEFVATIAQVLDDIQSTLHSRARAFRAEHLRTIDDKAEFLDYFTATTKPGQPTPIHGGFALTHFAGDRELEESIKRDHGVTVRCIPNPGELEDSEQEGTCPFTGQPSERRVLWAKAY